MTTSATPFPRRFRGPVVAGVLAAALVLAFATPSAAQEAAAEQSLGDLETQETASMRETTYKELAKAQEAVEAESYGQAIQILDKLSKEDLNNYERAQLLNLQAFVYYAQDQLGRAIGAYEQLLRQPELPEALSTSTLYTLAQLYFSREEWQKAVDALERWLAATPEPSRQAYEMMAQAYYQKGDHRKALDPARKVIELTRQAGEPVKEHSYLLLRVLYYELKDYPRVVDILHQLIETYPKKQYWMQLASLYGEMDRLDKQLNVLELAYLQGYLEQESEVLSLVSLLLNNEIYLRAGRILDKELASGTVTSTFEHWRLLAQAWTMSQEHERAIPALTRAAELAPDGRMDVILSQTLMNLDRWEEAVAAARTALRKGGLNRPDQVQVMLGQALFELGRFDEARDAFIAAQADQRSRQLAAQWLAYIDNEQERRAQLAAALE